MEKDVLLKGYNRFNFLIQKLNGLFDMNKAMGEYKLDDSKFVSRLEDIKIEFEKQSKLLDIKDNLSGTLKDEYEDLSLSPVCRQLIILINDYEAFLNPVRKIYVLMKTIDDSIKLNDKRKINSIVNLSIELVKSMDNISIHNNDVIISLISKSSIIIYKVIKLEETIKSDKLLKFINNREYSISEVLVSNLLRNEVLKKMDKPVFEKVPLKQEIITTINSNNGIKQMNREEELKEVEDKISDLNRSIDNLKSKSMKINGKIASLKQYTSFQKHFYYTIEVSPFIVALCAGLLFTNETINEEHKYETFKLMDYKTGEVLEKNRKAKIPEDHNTEIYIYSPWEYSEIEKIYKRVCTCYNLNLDNMDFDLDNYNLDENCVTKESYFQYKNKLDKNDSTEKSSVLFGNYYYEIEVGNYDFLDFIFSLGVAAISFLFYGIFVIMLDAAGAYDLESFEDYVKNKTKLKKELSKVLKELKKYEKELQAYKLKEEELCEYEEVDISELLSKEGQNEFIRALGRQ